MQYLGALSEQALYRHSLFKAFIVRSLFKPGVIWGCFRLVTATQMTRTPTQMTITVAATGTIMFRSTHGGSPGNWDSLVSPMSLRPVPELAPPIRSKSLAKKNVNLNWITFVNWQRVSVMSEHANDSNGNDDDSYSRNNGDNQVDVGQEVHHRVLEGIAGTPSTLATVSGYLPSWS